MGNCSPNSKTAFREEIVRGSARAFIDAKMAEREDRLKRAGQTRYKVEPNIKDGKGGLRDLHTLHWLAKYLYGEERRPRRPSMPASSPSRSGDVPASCEDFLWTVRCHLHFLTGRAEERLSFDVQPTMAQHLGYRAAGGMLPVERFMKHYFLVAKDVGDLTTILCGTLEMQQLKSAPGLEPLLNPMTWRMRRQVRQKTDFRIDNDRLNVADQHVFKRDPVNLIRFFAAGGADRHLLAIRMRCA